MSDYETADGTIVSAATSVPMPTFSDAGVLLPDDADVLAGVIADKNAAFGNALTFFDANGKFLQSRPMAQICVTETAVLSAAFSLMAYIANNFDPAVASGRMQDAIAAIYFLTRKPASYTTVAATCVGAVSTLIPAGARAKDTSGNIYATQDAAAIGASGTVDVTFVCQSSGPVPCPAGTLTQIYQIIPGWDSVSNASDGIPGADIESRADFEARRQASVSINAYASTNSIQAATKAIAGVIDAYVSENATSADQTVGGVIVPAHGICVSVAGGADDDVAIAIKSKTAPGTPMGGNTSVSIPDTFSLYNNGPDVIHFQRAVATPIYVKVTLSASSNIPTTALASVQTAAIAAFFGTGLNTTSMERINSIVYASQFYADIRALGDWADVVNVKVSLDGSTWSDTVSVNQAQIATLVAGDISLASQ